MKPTAVVVLALFAGAVHGRSISLFSVLAGVLQRREDEVEVCRSDACVEAARNLLESIDRSVDPCDDFYGFACNGWIKKHPIPPMAISWNQFNILNERLDRRLRAILSEPIADEDEEMVKTTKKIFAACMDEERIERLGVQPLRDLLDRLGGWPLLSPEAFRRDRHWQEVAVAVTKAVGITPVLAVGVDVDLRNTSRNVIIVEQPPSSTPAYFFNDPDFILDYGSYLKQVVHLLRKERRTAGYNFILRSQVMKIAHFEKALTILAKKKEEMRLLEKFHHRVTVKRLQEWTDNAIVYSHNTRIDWKRYLQTLLDKDESEVNDETPVVVSDWNFLRDLFRLIDASQTETVVNFILWEVVKTIGRSTNRKMRQVELEFTKHLTGVKEGIPRWQECVHATDDVTFAVGYMYTKKHFDDDAKSKAIGIVENIRTEFRRELSEVTWIDEDTKRAALEKAEYMNHFIGYPNWYGNETALREYYKELKIGDDHFANDLAVRQFAAKKYLGELQKRTRRDEWPTGPAVINAYYNPRMNSIIFPAGILEAPFFSKDQPEALNYGSIGSVIGHEITHAFDDVGRQVDKLGNIHQWWSKETEATYLKNAQCFIEEYGKFRFPSLENLTETEVHLNGILTLGENIADNGGLSTALRAYKRHSRGKKAIALPGLEDFTPYQLFYLGFATTWCETASDASLMGEVMEGAHAPHSVRVLGSVSNSGHFSATWGCPRGSKMNPTKKCRLW